MRLVPKNKTSRKTVTGFLHDKCRSCCLHMANNMIIDQYSVCVKTQCRVYHLVNCWTSIIGEGWGHTILLCTVLHSQTQHNSTVNNRHTYTRFMALCSGLPVWAGTRKVKPIWILLKQETVSGSGISCTSPQADYHASTPPFSFLQAGCSFCCPASGVKALKAPFIWLHYVKFCLALMDDFC